MELESFMKAAGDGSRLKILQHLNSGPVCVCDMTPLVGLTQPAVSQHLKRLKEAGIVVGEKRGRWTFWSLDRQHPLYDILTSLLSRVPAPERTVSDLESTGEKGCCGA
ncbi:MULTISPECIES: ArsR/SmtB family transcription factor [Bhargavaea]|uniref:ArsR/SmtB family transcription factor n=1 Tax=Bhargavaea changchunensis TaxID=2134037 RepID=A0ABW2NGC1_9BACL|nr:metalloregulator ArsR/SmtB family transcription factor [Bhargavaea sp. CC-171006]